MPATTSPSDDFANRAKEILVQFLSQSHDDEQADFDALCTEHPDDADALKSLYAGALEAEDRLAFPKSVGSGPDESINVEPASSDAPMADVVERLAKTTPEESRYELRGEIARGGMGAIIKVWDKTLRRTLAMKVALGKEDPGKPGSSPPIDDRTLGRFLDEAQVTGQLDHPGILPVYELGVDKDGQVYFTMRLVKGWTLSDIFNLVKTGEEGWTQTRALGIILKVCEAMAYAHSKKVIHRDLKPANIMVGRFGEAYVMDWGLAKVLGHKDKKDIRIQAPSAASLSIRTDMRDTPDDSPLLTMDGDVVGTPAYMSPEQARGDLDAMGAPSDVYSIGAILYQLLAGHMPYAPPGKRVNALLIWSSVQDGPPKALQSVDADTPAELEAICEKAMARDCADRYQDTSELAADLSAYVEGRVVGAYETGPWAETRKWVSRNRPLAGSFVMALVLIAAGLSAWRMLETKRTNALERTRQQVDLALGEGHRLSALGQWTEVLAAAEQARVLVRAGESTEPLHERVEREAGALTRVADAELHAQRITQENSELLDALNEIRPPHGDEAYPTDYARLEEEFSAAFGRFGLEVDEGSVEEAAARFAERGLGLELAFALDAWAEARMHGNDLDAGRLVELSGRIDADPERQTLRVAVLEDDWETIRELAGSMATQDLSPQTLVSLGRALVHSGAVAEGVEVLRTGRERFPADVELCTTLARALLPLDRPEDIELAARHLTAALALRPESVEIRHQLGSALELLGDSKGAERLFRRSLELRPDDPHLLQHLAEAISTQGDPEAALPILLRRVELEPGSATGQNNLGFAYERLGEYGKALECYERALAIEPEFMGARAGTAGVLWALGRREEGVASIEWIVREFPELAIWWYRLGRWRFELDDVEAACAALEHAVELEPTNTEFLLVQGETLIFAGDPQGALTPLQRIVELEPDDIWVHCRLALAYASVGHVDSALASARAFLRVQPDKVQLIRDVVAQLRQQGEDLAAAECLAEIGRARPDLVQAWWQAGDLALETGGAGSVGKALDLWAEGLEHAPLDAGLHRRLALALVTRVGSNAEDFGRGVEYARRATELDANDAAAWQALGLALHRTDDSVAAMEALMHSLDLSGESENDFLTHLALALCSARIEGLEESRRWLDLAESQRATDAPMSVVEERILAEVLALLGIR